MAINVNNTNITRIIVNGDTEILQAQQNGSWIWAKPYTLTVSTSGSFQSTTLYRYSTHEPTAATGSSATLINGSTIYYNDVLYASATPSVGQYGTVTGTPATVNISTHLTGNITGNETIYFRSYACSCGSSDLQSACTSCLSTSCGVSASGLCTTAAYRKCNCRSTAISGSGCGICGGGDMAFS